MQGNPHYSEDVSDYTDTRDGREVVGAILALAYEQRTANLIAFLDGAHEPLPPGDGPLELYTEIVKRLGLKDD